MKVFTVKSKDKEYKVKANDFRSAVKVVKAITTKDGYAKQFKADTLRHCDRLKASLENEKWRDANRIAEHIVWLLSRADEYTADSLRAKDEASQLDVIQALVTDEQAAIAAYANAIKNLDGEVDPQYIEVLWNILREENKHVENLQAIITGNVTKKNVEDGVKDDASYAANLAEELASTLRRNKLDLAQKILRLLTNSCKQLGLSVIDSAHDYGNEDAIVDMLEKAVTAAKNKDWQKVGNICYNAMQVAKQLGAK